MAQTVVQEATTIRFGSAKFEVGLNVGALVNVGAIRDGVFEETWDKVTVMSDNAGIILTGIRNHKAALSGNLMEINLDNIEKFMGGLHDVTPAAGTPVNITDEVVVLTGTASVDLAHANGDKTEVTAIVVTDVPGTTTFVRDVDYIIGVDADGKTLIARSYPAAVATAQVDVDGANGDSSYNDASTNFATILAPGDHIIVSGFTAPATANNGVKTVVSATNAKIIVAEAVVTKAAGDTITITRGGIASGVSVEVDYTYTPNVSRTLTAGGIQTMTANVVRFTNTNAAGLIFRITVYKATVENGVKIEFPADDDEDPATVPIQMVGVIDVTRGVGDQLFEIYDTQHV